MPWPIPPRSITTTSRPSAVSRAQSRRPGATIRDYVDGKRVRYTGPVKYFVLAVARAEATHKVATEKCEAMSGDAQDDCKTRADADLEKAKRDAEMRRDGAG